MVASPKAEVKIAVDESPPAKKEDGPSPLFIKLLFIVGAFMYSSYTILVHLCEVDGKLPFSTGSVWLNVEIMKLRESSSSFQIPTLAYALPFSVPAILYAVNNNLATYMQLEMDPASYQMFGNFKILSTSLLYRLIMKRPITGIQWVALCMLMAAGLANSYGGLYNTSKEGMQIHITVAGLIMLSAYCTISGLAGVYTEYMFKKRFETSIHYQNMLLYTFGCGLNTLAFFAQNAQAERPITLFNLYTGYTFWTWALVLSQVASGLIISGIMKFANNIAKLFMIGGSMLITTVASVLIFQLTLNVYYAVAVTMVLVALYLYNKS